MSFRIEVKPTVLRELAKVPRPMRERIAWHIDSLSENPHPPGSVKLAGEDNLYRIRVGDYRVIYQVQEGALLVLVVRIGHRRCTGDDKLPPPENTAKPSDGGMLSKDLNGIENALFPVLGRLGVVSGNV